MNLYYHPQLTYPSVEKITKYMHNEEGETYKEKYISQSVRLQGRKRAELPLTFIRENVRKTKKRFVDFENKGSGVVYAWGRY